MNATAIAPLAPPALPVPPSRINKPKNIQELLGTVSASRLNTFHSCRLKFYFNYVLGLTRAKNGAQHIGSSVRFTLKLWNIARWRKRTIPEGWLKEQLDLFGLKIRKARLVGNLE